MEEGLEGNAGERTGKTYIIVLHCVALLYCVNVTDLDKKRICQHGEKQKR